MDARPAHDPNPEDNCAVDASAIREEVTQLLARLVLPHIMAELEATRTKPSANRCRSTNLSGNDGIGG